MCLNITAQAAPLADNYNYATERGLPRMMSLHTLGFPTNSVVRLNFKQLAPQGSAASTKSVESCVKLM